MTRLEQLKELQARLDKATGPRKELDRALARAGGWHRVEPRHGGGARGGWIAPEDFLGVHTDGSPILDSLHGTSIYRDPPRFSASIDAALAWVEKMLPGVQMVIDATYKLGDPRTTTVTIYTNLEFDECVQGSHPSMPLAILKAGVAALISQAYGEA